MDLIASIFDSKCKCNRCARVFKLTSKRRKCIICSKSYLELIFCKRCSVKITKHGFFKSKRYCTDCHNKEAMRNEEKREQEKRRKKVTSLEEVVADMGITQQELAENRKQIQEVVKTVNDGIRSLPRTSSVRDM